MYFTDETFYICVVMVPSREKVFLMNKADDIIDRIVIDRNAGVAILCKQHRKLFHGDRIWGSDNIHTGCQDFFHFHVVELDGSADEFALMVLQPTLVFCLLYHSDKFFLRNALLLRRAEETHRSFLEETEKQVQGSQQDETDF